MRNLGSFEFKKSIQILFLDFDGVLTNNSVHIDELGREYVTCCRYDGFGIASLLKHGITPIVLTTETKPLARQRCLKLQLACFDCIEDKYSAALKILESRKLSFSQASFLGNDINDLVLLKNVAFPIVTPDSHESIHNEHFYVTSRSGGNGCVREVCEFLCSQ